MAGEHSRGSHLILDLMLRTGSVVVITALRTARDM